MAVLKFFSALIVTTGFFVAFTNLNASEPNIGVAFSDVRSKDFEQLAEVSSCTPAENCGKEMAVRSTCWAIGIKINEVCNIAFSRNQDSNSGSAQQYSYDALQNRIIRGQAKFEEILYALTDDQPSRLSNVFHSLSLYRDDNRIFVLLTDIWKDNRTDHPELSWAAMSDPHARVALATTLARIDKDNYSGYYSYVMLNVQNDDSEVRANSAIGLGFIGGDQDIGTLREMIISDPITGVAANAATALILIGTKAAEDALEGLLESPLVSAERKQILSRLFTEIGIRGVGVD